jgi:hypothetical protein
VLHTYNLPFSKYLKGKVVNPSWKKVDFNLVNIGDTAANVQ